VTRWLKPAQLRSGAKGLLMWALVFAIVRTTLIPAISLFGNKGDVYAVFVALGLIVGITAVALRWQRVRALFFTRQLLADSNTAWKRAVVAAVFALLMVCVYVCQSLFRKLDWDGLLQRLCSVAVWMVAAYVAGNCLPQRRSFAAKRTVALLAAVAVGGSVLWGAPRVWAMLHQPVSWHEAAERETSLLPTSHVIRGV